jgi:hypothetical protein
MAERGFFGTAGTGFVEPSTVGTARGSEGGFPAPAPTDAAAARDEAVTIGATDVTEAGTDDGGGTSGGASEDAAGGFGFGCRAIQTKPPTEPSPTSKTSPTMAAMAIPEFAGVATGWAPEPCVQLPAERVETP